MPRELPNKAFPHFGKRQFLVKKMPSKLAINSWIKRELLGILRENPALEVFEQFWMVFHEKQERSRMGIHDVDDGCDYRRLKSIPGVLIPWQLPAKPCQEKAAAQDLQDPSPATVNNHICFPGKKIQKRWNVALPASAVQHWNLGMGWVEGP